MTNGTIVYTTDISPFELLEREYGMGYNRRCIDHRIVGSSKCVGYCKCEMHEGFLTEKLMRQHQCKAKECFHFVARERRAYR